MANNIVFDTLSTIDDTNNYGGITSLPPAAYIASTNGTAINCQGYEAVTLILSLGAYTDGNFAFYLADSPDDNDDFTPVLATSGLILPLNANGAINPQLAFPYSISDTDYTITDANYHHWTGAGNTGNTFWVGYVGVNQWVQPQMYCDDTTDGMIFSMSILLGWPHTAPTRLWDGNQVG